MDKVKETIRYSSFSPEEKNIEEYLNRKLSLEEANYKELATRINWLLKRFYDAGIYISGDGTSDGDWRTYDDGTDMYIQVKIAGVWTNALTIAHP